MYRIAALVALLAITTACSGAEDEPAAEDGTAALVAETIDWRANRFVVPRGTRVVIRETPGGQIVGRAADRTEFGSRETLVPTGQRRGSWVEVRHTSLGNSATGWVDLRAASALELEPHVVEIAIDLSDRELLVYRLGTAKPQRRLSVAIGAPATPTPPGIYYVTDKLPGARYGEFYGCCILALSGRQPNLPQGWSGGDRLAIHGSPTPTWGKNVSNGCLHASESDLRYLMKIVPLGAVVRVRA